MTLIEDPVFSENEPTPAVVGYEHFPRSDKKYETGYFYKPELGLSKANLRDAKKVGHLSFYGFKILLANLLTPGAYAAGGFFTNQACDLPVSKDVDVFFKNREAAEAIIKKVKSPSEYDVLARLYEYVPAVRSDGSYSTKLGPNIEELRPIADLDLPVIQLISLGFYEDASHVIDNFDFTCVQIAMDHQGEFTYSKEFVKDIKDRAINLNKVEAVSRLESRVERYEAKGFKASAETLETIAKLRSSTAAGATNYPAVNDYWRAYDEFDSPIEEGQKVRWHISYKSGHPVVKFRDPDVDGKPDFEIRCDCKPKEPPCRNLDGSKAKESVS